MNYKIFKSVSDLNQNWDTDAGDNFFLKTISLDILEKSNPCEQKYLYFPDSKSILVSYMHKLNIFTYSKFNLTIPVRIFGVPCSVAMPGYNKIKNNRNIFEYIKNQKGVNIILNCNDFFNESGFINGNTLRTMKLDLSWTTFNDYLKNMRSHYRYTITKSLEKWSKVKKTVLKNNMDFTDEMYQQYIDVYNKSEYKLEKLSIDFFKTFPATIIKYEISEYLLGFIQIKIHDNRLIFMFNGFNYLLNEKYNIYTNLLLDIVKIGIDNQCSQIDFGQTAEVTKGRLGATGYEKFMYFRHSNKLIYGIAKMFSSFLSYNIIEQKFNVFKDYQ